MENKTNNISRNKELIEEIHYESGGILYIYSDGSRSYTPSSNYLKFKERVTKINCPNNKLSRTIRHNRNKLLFQEGICVSGDRLLDKLLTPQTRFNFTNIKTRTYNEKQ